MPGRRFHLLARIVVQPWHGEWKVGKDFIDSSASSPARFAVCDSDDETRICTTGTLCSQKWHVIDWFLANWSVYVVEQI
jgi:hypothetical protein